MRTPRSPGGSTADGRLDVLVLNWRDLRHPRAGGAEVLTHGHASRLAERGHRVTMFVGAVPGAPPDERVDGVEIVRRGGPVTTRAHAVRWYRAQARAGRRFDVVVEEINTLPYFVGLAARTRCLLWIHQLAREVWWHEAPRPLAPVGYGLEGAYLRLYRATPAIVPSESTKRDLVALGFRGERVAVVPPGIYPPGAESETEKEAGLLVYVGRVTPSKRVRHLLVALAAVRSAGIAARLEIVGRAAGGERESLAAYARELKVAPYVGFRGYVGEAEKQDLLRRASLLVMASVREGWGLAVTEANILGTPAVVYDRPGLRDSTVHEQTGLVTGADPASLAAGIVRALREPGLYDRLRDGALEWGRTFTWERASVAFERALYDVAGGDHASGTPGGQ
ncbi:MAG: glycosyltransferase family 4 protein [Thermoleophilia bacterium]|nr:glycosyltransferase family 4 protein [Thermoleophilia bacterium]